jgi:hypothetical protein
LLERAITEKESDTNKAMLDANNALILFLEFNNGSKNEIISSAQREYDLNSLKEILTGYGLSEERALEEITLLQTTGIERGIELVKIGDSNNYLVRIVITLNMDINGESIKIVEIIPKEIVDSARKIISSEEFKILKDDPIIEYTILRADGARKKIYYSVGEVTQEKAQEMMDNNVLSKYSTPPFIVKEEEKSEELLASKISEGNLLVLILGLIILIVLIAGAVYLVKSKGSGHGFGEKKSVIEKLTPEKQPEPKKWEANK